MALLVVAPLAKAAEPAASGYVATMADYMGVQNALQRYRIGVEKHDQKMLESAFWDDAVNIAVPTPGGPEIRIPVKRGGPPPPGAGQPGPNAGPPPGPTAGPPGAGGGRGGPPNAAGRVEVWHLPLDSYIHFESATRATHYGYFLSIYPQPEKQALDPSSMPNASASRNSIVGWPGHYDDILEKRNGEWRILQRKSMINQK
jgi:hypothetical protein